MKTIVAPATASPVGGEPVDVQYAANTIPAEPPAHTAHASGLTASLSERSTVGTRGSEETAAAVGDAVAAMNLEEACDDTTNASAAPQRHASARRTRRGVAIFFVCVGVWQELRANKGAAGGSRGGGFAEPTNQPTPKHAPDRSAPKRVSENRPDVQLSLDSTFPSPRDDGLCARAPNAAPHRAWVSSSRLSIIHTPPVSMEHGAVHIALLTHVALLDRSAPYAPRNLARHNSSFVASPPPCCSIDEQTPQLAGHLSSITSLFVSHSSSCAHVPHASS